MPEHNDVRAGVLREILHVLPDLEGADVSLSAHLRDLGADSIERVEILQGIVRRFALPLPIAEVARAQNIGDLVAIVEEHRRG